MGILGILGWIMLVAAWFCIMVAAFAESTTWGLLMLFLGGLLWPIFVIKYWSKTSFWFFVGLGGFVLVQLGAH